MQNFVRVLFPFATGLVALSGCAIFNPNRQFWVYGGATTQVRLVIDAPEVRKFLAEPDARQAMADAPGFYVPGKSYCIIAQRSTAKCGKNPFETPVYSLVRITSG